MGDVSLHFFAWFVDWTMGDFVDGGIGTSLGVRLHWIAAAVQLDVHGLDWLSLRELFDSGQVKLHVALGLSKVDWLAV